MYIMIWWCWWQLVLPLINIATYNTTAQELFYKNKNNMASLGERYAVILYFWNFQIKMYDLREYCTDLSKPPQAAHNNNHYVLFSVFTVWVYKICMSMITVLWKSQKWRCRLSLHRVIYKRISRDEMHSFFIEMCTLFHLLWLNLGVLWCSDMITHLKIVICVWFVVHTPAVKK